MAKISGKDGKAIVGTSVNIGGASGTTTIVVLEAQEGWAVGDRVLIEGVVGMTDINGEHTITAVNSSVSFTVVLPTATSQTYTSGGSAVECVSITGWNLDLAGEVIKVTDSSNTTWDAYIASGWVGGSGTFEGFFEGNTKDLVIGTSYPVILRLGEDYYTLTAEITGNSSTLDVPGAEAVKKSYTFTATSTITLTVA